MRFVTLLSFCVFAAGTVTLADPEDTTIWGECRIERIKGHPGDYELLNEAYLYLSPDNGVGRGRFCLVGMGALPGGTYGFTEERAPEGWYTIYMTWPWVWVAPKVLRDVYITDGQLDERHVETNLDYSCYVQQSATPSDSAWYQTFRATGTSINRIQWKLAGWNTSEVEVSIHLNNGGAITSWPQIGPAKRAGTGGGDAWVGFRSGDISTTPHSRYAVKLRGVGGGIEVRCRNEDSNGYALGQAYDASGNPYNADLLTTVFSDNDGTVIPYLDMDSGDVEQLLYGAEEWGQTLTATGVALAAADLYCAGCHPDHFVAIFRIFAGEPGQGGPQIGPTKTTEAVSAAGVNNVGVSYAPGEVMLTPGSKYYIQMKGLCYETPSAFTACAFHHNSDNRYGPGTAWSGNGVDDPTAIDEDLQMTVIEYQPWYSASLVNPDFEDYGGYLDGWEITKFDGKGPDDPPLSDGAYGVEAPDEGHFAGKITSGQSMDFGMGQIILVEDYGPGSTTVHWSLSANVHLHSRSGSTPVPGNVHQLWEIGWNDDGSIPCGVNRCDNYQVAKDIDGNYTGNDDKYFHPMSADGQITDVADLEAVVFRVRLYNDTTLSWSMDNIDNVTFEAAEAPPGPEIEVVPQIIENSVWIGDTLDDDVFTVANSGIGTLEYSVEVEGEVDWLSVWPESGSSTGGADPIEVRYDDEEVADLDAGQYTAIISVSSEDAWNSPETVTVVLTVETVGPDFDGDADVDLEDFAFLQRCFSGWGVPFPSGCDEADLHEDDDVDRDDLDIFLGCLTGANLPADPDCEG